ncbi:hypothetical protein FY036_14510 [Mesorhizobium microcysteis]|uniref:Yip1 domain-containing protein n=1 Tax=Neoaquamicrobium microcysteis TaxID=2682781 RepID=A0A5D4GRV3_9HYPH|nr:hypothetical protein [Mesorhizobium microcysteis]TYR31486.1 hypothetical protein FY036_14510 [Mesorhizobium microcysteis]
MDFFNFAKAVEQGIYDVMMWILFYPLTLLRMIIFPASTLQYVYAEARKDQDSAFAEAIRPALLIFISIAIGTFLAPFSADQRALLEGTPIGSLVTTSWFFLVFYRMVVFSLFPLCGALLLDLLTPGPVSRETLRTPFYLQCYICAPFALIASPTLVNIQHDSWSVYAAFAAVTLWFLAVQYIFFRDYARQTALRALLLAPAVLLLGTFGGIVLGLVAAS